MDYVNFALHCRKGVKNVRVNVCDVISQIHFIY